MAKIKRFDRKMKGKGRVIDKRKIMEPLGLKDFLTSYIFNFSAYSYDVNCPVVVSLYPFSSCENSVIFSAVKSLKNSLTNAIIFSSFSENSERSDFLTEINFSPTISSASSEE